MSRLYSFVASNYLSPLQCGLQSGHVVSELSLFKPSSREGRAFQSWARDHKTIVILSVGNHAGVQSAYERLVAFGQEWHLPRALFEEDEASMNRMCTAAGIILPEMFYNVKLIEDDVLDRSYWLHQVISPDGTIEKTVRFDADTSTGQFISWFKSLRTA